MRWSIKIAEVGGTEVRLHLTFVVFLAWIGFSYYQLGGVPAAWQSLVFLLALFGSVLLHEFGHALAARAFGIRTPDITLLPIGGVARLERMPKHPGQELVIALAGPAVNVGIAAVLILVLGPFAGIDHLERLNEPGVAMLAKLASVNIGLVLFNLIPAFPMDGGRVVRALLAMMLPYARATAIAAVLGQIVAVGLGLIGLFANPLLIFIAFFIFLGAHMEATAAQIKEITSGLTVSEAMVTHLVRLPPEARLDDAVEALMRSSQHEFPVVAKEGQLLGVLTRDDLIAALKQYGLEARVSDFMKRDLPVVYAHESFDEAFRKMEECRCPALPVVDWRGRFVGLITPENLGELMMVRSVCPSRGRPSWHPATQVE